MEDISIALPEGGHINVWHRQGTPNSPTAVLIHGLTGTSRWWVPVIDHIPDGMGLIVPDVRGRGASWDSPGPFGVADAAEDIALALDHFDVDRAVIAGYSMGAWVAAVFAGKHPDRARQALLVDGGLPVPYDGSLSRDDILDRLIGPSLQRLQMSFASIHAYVAFYKDHPAFGPLRGADLRRVLEYELVPRSNDYKIRASRDAIKASGADISINPEIVAAGAAVPVNSRILVVDHGMFGQPGGFVPLDVARRADEANPNLTHTLLEGLNHYTLMFGDGAPLVAAAIAGHG